MIFWDTSAVVPLLMHEKTTRMMMKVFKADPEMLVWWGTGVECVSAISRMEREASRSNALAIAAMDRLGLLASSWIEVSPSNAVRETAQRLLRVHPLRAADGIQLAAAIVGAEGRPSSLEFNCLDARLVDAARREGFTTI